MTIYLFSYVQLLWYEQENVQGLPEHPLPLGSTFHAKGQWFVHIGFKAISNRSHMSFLQ